MSSCRSAAPPSPDLVTTLITGAGGLLGSHLAARFSRDGRVVAVDRRPWWGDTPADSVVGDLLTPGWIEQVIGDAAPQVILHCAAMVDLEACERDPHQAELVNAALTRRVARAAPTGCLVVYISTDGLFDGRESWMTEQTLPCPRTAYGRSKIHGEWETQLATPDHLIIRTNFFGWSSGRKVSSAEWLFAALERRTRITMFDDFHFTPIYVVPFVDAVHALSARQARGVVHVAGADRVTKYDFAMALADVAGLDPSAVLRGSMRDATLVADRPADMSLSSSRCSMLIGATAPSVRDGLRQFVTDRHRPLNARF